MFQQGTSINENCLVCGQCPCNFESRILSYIEAIDAFDGYIFQENVRP